MRDGVDIFDYFVKRSFLHIIKKLDQKNKIKNKYLFNVLDDDELQIIAMSKSRKVILHILALLLATNSATDCVSTLEKVANDPHGEIAIGSRHKNFIAFTYCWHFTRNRC